MNEVISEDNLFFQPLFYQRGESAFCFQKIIKTIEHPFDMMRMTRALLALNPDIVHFQWLVLPFLDTHYLQVLRKRSALIYTIHNSVTNHGAALALTKFLERRAIRMFQDVIVHTARSAEFAARLGFVASQIHLIPHPPIGLKTVLSSSKKAQMLGQCRFLLFGVLKPYKGVSTLVDAGIQLARRRSDFLITIAGKPMMDMNPLKEKAAKSALASHIRFELEFMPEEKLAAKIAESDVIVLPYLDIDGSGALAVAVDAGKPIVASDVGGFAEPPLREHITIVPAGDSTALARALEALLDDRSQLNVLAQRTKALRKLLPNWQQFAEAIHDVYRKAL